MNGTGDVGDSDKDGSGSETQDDISKQGTPPKNSTGSNPTHVNNSTTDADTKQGFSKARAAGAAGTAAFALDALATGNLGGIGDNLKEFGQKIIDGNIFGKDGAVADVEGLIVGKASLDTARSQIDKGQIASGFATLAKGLLGQAVNGVAEIGEIGIAFGAASIGNGSYAENRRNDYIPNLNFGGSAAAGEMPAVAQQQAYMQQQAYAQSIAQTGTYPHIQAAAAANPVHPLLL